MYFFPSTVYGITPKRFSWNGFVYEKEDAKDGHVIIGDYTKNERKVTIPSEIPGEKVEVVSSLGDSKKIKTISLPDNVEIAAKALSQCPNLKTVHVKKSNPLYQWKNGLLLSKDGRKLVSCPGGNQNLFFVKTS